MFTMKQFDTSPVIQARLRTSANTVVTLTGATVKFIMKSESNKVLVSSPADIVDQYQGIVKYEWQPNDVSQSGMCLAEFEVTYEDDSVETFPNNGYIKIKVLPDLG
jgi:hypothetical protein